MGPNEAAVAAVLRAEPRREHLLVDVWRESGVSKRAVRHHLRRFVEAGLVEVIGGAVARDGVVAVFALSRFRWRDDA